MNIIVILGNFKFYFIYIMGSLFGKGKKNEEKGDNKKNQSQIQEVDIVKSKLKIAKDKINNFSKAKSKEINQIDEEIKTKIPEF